MNEVLVVVGFQIKFPFSFSSSAAAAVVDCLSKLTNTLQLFLQFFASSYSITSHFFIFSF